MPSRSAPRPRKPDSTVVELPVTAKAVKTAVTASRSTDGTARDGKQDATSAKPTKKKTTTSKKPAIGTPKEAVATAVATEPEKEAVSARAESSVMSIDDRPSAPAMAAGPARKPAPRRKAADSSSARPASKQAPSDEQVPHEVRLQYIAEAAYYIAERRGFAPGYEHQNWLEAEAEVNERLGTSGAVPKNSTDTDE
jgi:hypothetical protein